MGSVRSRPAAAGGEWESTVMPATNTSAAFAARQNGRLAFRARRVTCWAQGVSSSPSAAGPCPLNTSQKALRAA
jgi:hypothetical protein